MALLTAIDYNVALIDAHSQPKVKKNGTYGSRMKILPEYVKEVKRWKKEIQCWREMYKKFNRPLSELKPQAGSES